MINDGLEEVDWKSYVEIIEMIINGEYDYGLIKGENGYCVYPAGFVYEFYFIYYMTSRGKPIISLFLFLFVFFIMTYVIFKVYDSVLPKEYNWIKIFCAVSTNVEHSVINHRFNDSLAMTPLYLCLFFLINNQKKGLYYATFFYALALSTKTNILLYLPGLIYIFTKIKGPIFAIIQLIIIILFQFIIGYPFIKVSAANYFGKTYDFSREFLYSQTMNWQFIPEEIFHSQFFYNTLAVVHLGILAIFFLFKWEKLSLNIFKDVRLNDWSWEMKVVPLNKNFILRVLFICNLIGILCFRSLHYQYVVWYFTSFPFLIWQTKFNDFFKVFYLLSYPFVFSYQRSPLKSIVILIIHLILLISLLFYDKPCDQCDKETLEIEEENKSRDKSETKKIQ